MKKNISTWVIPISVSLLLHIVMLQIFSNQKSNTQALIKSEVLTVELQSTLMPQAVAKPRKQILLKEKIKEPVEQQAIVKNSISPEPVKSEVLTETAPSISKNSTIVIQPQSKLTRLPSFLKQIEPVYPLSEQQSNRQAKFFVEITLDADGKVLDIKVPKNAGKYFEKAIIDAIKQSTFTPGYIENRSVAVKLLVPYGFVLN